MLEKGKVDIKQAILLVVIIILPTDIITLPALSIKIAKQDAWISAILSTLAGLLITWLVVSLSLRFPGKTLFEFSEDILGKVIGKIIGFSYFVWFIHTNMLIIREFGSFINVSLLLDTPIIVFYIISVAVSAYAIYNGLEVLGKFCQIFIPTILFLLLIVFTLTIGNMNLTRLLPTLDAGIVPILEATLTPISWMGEIILFAMFIPFLTKPDGTKRAGILGILIIGFMTFSSVFISLAVFGPNVSGRMMYSVFNAVRTISIANFLERLESVVITAWILITFAKIAIFYYAAVLGGAQLFGLKSYRPMIFPVGVILVVLSAFSLPSTVGLADFLTKSYTFYAPVFFEIGIPLVLLIIALILKKGGKNAKKNLA